MASANKIAKNLLFAIPVLFLVSGCSRLRWLDQKAGEIFFDQAPGRESASTTPETRSISGFSVAPISASDLTQEQKDQIDKWLADNNLNRYGDELGTFYAGGTPLFNEATGISKERFEYILEKTPDILEKMKVLE